MKVTKWIQVETEVEFDVSAEEIAAAVTEEEGEGVKAVLSGLNRIAAFMRGIPDVAIAGMTDTQRRLIATFLEGQRERYRNEGAKGEGK